MTDHAVPLLASNPLPGGIDLQPNVTVDRKLLATFEIAEGGCHLNPGIRPCGRDEHFARAESKGWFAG